MTRFTKIYHPREDSLLIKAQIAEYANGKVLDMGTGTGILALEAAKCKKVSVVLAADINPEAVKYCKKNIHNAKIKFIVSDLFSGVKGKAGGKSDLKFDLIIFNPPYLPNPKDKKLKDIALDGGEKGYELTVKFLDSAGKHLKKDGKILLLISSFTKKKIVEKNIKKNGFKFSLIAEKKLDFEWLYVYLIERRK